MKRLHKLAVVLMLSAGCSGDGRPRPGTIIVEPEPEAAAILWYEVQPRVLAAGQTTPVHLTVAIDGSAARVQISYLGGNPVQLSPAGNGIWSGDVPADVLLFGYRTGDLHNGAAIISVTSSTNVDRTMPLVVNVRDATVPIVEMSTPEPGVQIMPHVVNIRWDDLLLTGTVPTALTRKFYEHLPDNYQFLAVVTQVTTPGVARQFLAVRNSIKGLGQQIFDSGNVYGSPATLEGIIQFRNDGFYDPALTYNLHELAHRWMNYSTLPALERGKPHWPLSTMASGVLGWNNPADNTRNAFPFNFTPQPNGTLLVSVTEQPREFNDLELYFMGLLPADSVGVHFVPQNQNQVGQLKPNGVIVGPFDTVTVAKIVARDGARQPGAGTAPREFRLATIVLSRGGVLSRQELSLFEQLAVRGEAQTELTFNTGVQTGRTLPFFNATGGRGRLITRIATPPQSLR